MSQDMFLVLKTTRLRCSSLSNFDSIFQSELKFLQVIPSDDFGVSCFSDGIEIPILMGEQDKITASKFCVEQN